MKDRTELLKRPKHLEIKFELRWLGLLTQTISVVEARAAIVKASI